MTRKEKSKINKEAYRKSARYALSKKITKDIDEHRSTGFPFPRKGLQKPPTDLQERKKLADEFIQWASKEDSFVLEEFPLSKGISPYRFYQMFEEDEYLADAMDIARSFISNHFQTGALSGQVETYYALQMLPLFNREFREWQTEKVSKKIDAARKSIINLIEEPLLVEALHESGNNDKT